MRLDFYNVEICDESLCLNCAPLQESAAGTWSNASCGISGTEVLLTKTVPTQFQLIEVDLYGVGK